MVTFSDKLTFKGIHKSADKYVCVMYIDPRSKYGYTEYQCFFGKKNIDKLSSLKDGDLFVVSRNEFSKKKEGSWRSVVLYDVYRANKE